MRNLLVFPLMLIATAALADPLPLARGVYVQRGTPCADPPFAAMRSYDGRGLADPHSRDCRIRVLTKRGMRYTVANDCIGAGSGPAPRDIERLTVDVRSQTAFSLASKYGATSYRLCPPASRIPALPNRIR